jgi:hypothetical protein
MASIFSKLLEYNTHIICGLCLSGMIYLLLDNLPRGGQKQEVQGATQRLAPQAGVTLRTNMYQSSRTYTHTAPAHNQVKSITRSAQQSDASAPPSAPHRSYKARREEVLFNLCLRCECVDGRGAVHSPASQTDKNRPVYKLLGVGEDQEETRSAPPLPDCAVPPWLLGQGNQ